jgi:hypothetical protein
MNYGELMDLLGSHVPDKLQGKTIKVLDDQGDSHNIESMTTFDEANDCFWINIVPDEED